MTKYNKKANFFITLGNHELWSFNGLPFKKIVETYKVIKKKIKLLGYIHMVWWNRVNEPSNNVRLEGCRSRLYKLLDVYDDLDIGL